MNYIFISKTTVRRFLNEEESTRKDPIIRVKMECFKTPRLFVWKKNKNIDLCNIVFTDESSFIFIIQKLVCGL